MKNFDLDKTLESIIDMTKVFLLETKETVKDNKELNPEDFLTYLFRILNESEMDNSQNLFITHLINNLWEFGFFNSPASIKYHGNYRCGLAEHSIGVLYYLLKFYHEFKDIRENFSLFDIFIAGICHDLCKIGLYLEVKIDPTSIPNGMELDKEQPRFVKNYNRRSLGHGEQSVWTFKNLEYLIKTNHQECENVEIKFEVIEAIRWHMGKYDISNYGDSEFDKAKRNNKLVLLTHYADDLTSSWDNR